MCIGYNITEKFENVYCGNDVSLGRKNLFLSSNAAVRIGDNVMFRPRIAVVMGEHRINVYGKLMIEVAEKLTKNDQDVVFEALIV